jgi:hypothetical protein
LPPQDLAALVAAAAFEAVMADERMSVFMI